MDCSSCCTRSSCCRRLCCELIADNAFCIALIDFKCEAVRSCERAARSVDNVLLNLDCGVCCGNIVYIFKRCCNIVACRGAARYGYILYARAVSLSDCLNLERAVHIVICDFNYKAVERLIVAYAENGVGFGLDFNYAVVIQADCAVCFSLDFLREINCFIGLCTCYGLCCKCNPACAVPLLKPELEAVICVPFASRESLVCGESDDIVRNLVRYVLVDNENGYSAVCNDCYNAVVAHAVIPIFGLYEACAGIGLDNCYNCPLGQAVYSEVICICECYREFAVCIGCDACNCGNERLTCLIFSVCERLAVERERYVNSKCLICGDGIVRTEGVDYLLGDGEVTRTALYVCKCGCREGIISHGYCCAVAVCRSGADCGNDVLLARLLGYSVLSCGQICDIKRLICLDRDCQAAVCRRGHCALGCRARCCVIVNRIEQIRCVAAGKRAADGLDYKGIIRIGIERGARGDKLLESDALLCGHRELTVVTERGFHIVNKLVADALVTHPIGGRGLVCTRGTAVCILCGVAVLVVDLSCGVQERRRALGNVPSVARACLNGFQVGAVYLIVNACGRAAYSARIDMSFCVVGFAVACGGLIARVQNIIRAVECIKLLVILEIHIFVFGRGLEVCVRMSD